MKTQMNLNQQSVSVIAVPTVNNNDLSIDVNSLMFWLSLIFVVNIGVCVSMPLSGL